MPNKNDDEMNTKMAESINILSRILKDKLISFIARFPYFPSFELRGISLLSTEDILNKLQQHISKTDIKYHENLIKAMSAHTYGIEWYNQQIMSLLNMGEAIQKLNDNDKNIHPVIYGITNIITEMSNRNLWVITV